MADHTFHISLRVAASVSASSTALVSAFDDEPKDPIQDAINILGKLQETAVTMQSLEQTERRAVRVRNGFRQGFAEAMELMPAVENPTELGAVAGSIVEQLEVSAASKVQIKNTKQLLEITRDAFIEEFNDYMQSIIGANRRFNAQQFNRVGNIAKRIEMVRDCIAKSETDYRLIDMEEKKVYQRLLQEELHYLQGVIQVARMRFERDGIQKNYLCLRVWLH